MPTFKKIDKEFQLSDSTVNCYGYRLLTSGYLMGEYKKNPIGYYMHERNGTLVKWEDLRVDGDKVMGKPVVNLSHPRGEQTVQEIENGFLNAASVGHIIVLEVSDEPSLKLAGQTGPTVTKWYNRECSLVDIPGNFNALTNLYDKDNNQLNLADFTKPKIIMDKIVFTAANLAAMNLQPTATESEVSKSFNDLVAKAGKADSLEVELKDLKAATIKKRNTANLAAAVTDKKISVALSEKLAADYATNPDGLENLLADMQPQTLITKNLKAEDKGDNKYKDLIAKGWDTLFEEDKIEDLKANNPEGYKALYKATFGKEPTVQS